MASWTKIGQCNITQKDGTLKTVRKKSCRQRVRNSTSYLQTITKRALNQYPCEMFQLAGDKRYDVSKV